MSEVYSFKVKTSYRSQLVDITPQVKDIIFLKSGVKDGICVVFSSHTTGGITINENADPDVKHDILTELDKIVPLNDGYLHCEGNSAAHIKASLMGFSQTIIISDSKPVLGIWQDIYFAEFDGPRNRTVYVKIIEG